MLAGYDVRESKRMELSSRLNQGSWQPLLKLISAESAVPYLWQEVLEAIQGCPYDAILLTAGRLVEAALEAIEAEDCTATILGTFDTNEGTFKALRTVRFDSVRSCMASAYSRPSMRMTSPVDSAPPFTSCTIRRETYTLQSVNRHICRDTLLLLSHQHIS